MSENEQKIKGDGAQDLREAVDLQTLVDDLVTACQYIEARENTAPYVEQTAGTKLYSRLLGHIGELRALPSLAALLNPPDKGMENE